jgi:UDP-glucose 4-epimerase
MWATPETWLITGGAGYIGAHIADAFLLAGKNVVIYDSLYNSSVEKIGHLEKKYKTHIPFIKGDICDESALNFALHEKNISGIVHLAALKSVEESFKNPDLYYKVNYGGTKNVIDSATSNSVRKIIFSSTAAIYGNPIKEEAIQETDEAQPISPYGKTKLLAEEEIKKYLGIPGNRGTCLRFFNVIGTSSSHLVDNSKDNLVPKVIEAIKNSGKIEIFGNDYSTRDGTCIRDYVDVRDIAKAHLLAAGANEELPQIINIGTGVGITVKEAISEICKVFEVASPSIHISKRRDGDPDSLWADINLAKSKLRYVADYVFTKSINSLHF